MHGDSEVDRLSSNIPFCDPHTFNFLSRPSSLDMNVCLPCPSRAKQQVDQRAPNLVQPGTTTETETETEMERYAEQEKVTAATTISTLQ